MLTNRLIWVGVGLLLLVVTYVRFLFEERVKKARWWRKSRPGDDTGKDVFTPLQRLSHVSLHFGWSAQ